MESQEPAAIRMADFMDVVYKCKFCPYTCSQSSAMSNHVKENHLSSVQVQLNQECSKSDTPCSSVISHAQSVSVTADTNQSTTHSHSHIKTDQNINIPMDSSESEDVLGFSDHNQTYVDKSLTPDNFTHFAVSVSRAEQVNLSNTSTPDLSELITLVKPTRSSSSMEEDQQHCNTTHQNSSKLCSSSVDASTVYTSAPSLNVSRVEEAVTSEKIGIASLPGLGQFVVQVMKEESPTSDQHADGRKNQGAGDNTQKHIPEGINTVEAASFFNTELLSATLDDSGLAGSEAYTVMAIQIPPLDSKDTDSVPQFVVSAPVQEAPAVPSNADTKEFLLCGLCKLAFTSMEDCHAHMQMEHRELMQDSGVSIGVQVGGAKRGRKRKSEQPVRKKIKEEPTEPDPEYDKDDDSEWLPSSSELCSHGEGGRVRRRVKPPRALKEDYVLSRRHSKQRTRGSLVDNGCKRLSCPMMGCKVKLKTAEGLQIHIDCHNMEDTALTCKECQAPHEFWKDLRVHLWKKHKIDCDLFTCEACNYKTDTQYKMNVHMEIHSESKPYTCDICGKGFRQASQMKNHQLLHSRSDVKEVGRGWHQAKTCDICDRIFANSKCLKKHKEFVHGNLKPYTCNFCSHTTARKAMMELHMRTHTGEKPFKCDICKYSTSDHNSLRRHKMRHTGQKQYRCSQCPYTCIQSISLKQHMRHKHPGTSAGIFQCSRCPFRSINQNIYLAHMQDHKKGLIPDKLMPPQLELPKARKAPTRSHNAVGSREFSAVTTLMLKHPQLHAVLPGEIPANFNSNSNSTGDDQNLAEAETATSTTGSASDNQAEVFNMQITMLAGGDTQISAEDMTRLSESPGLAIVGTTALQLIYDTLATLGGHSELKEGQSTLLTTQLPGAVHTSVLSSLQDGLTVHNITYHLPRVQGVEETGPSVASTSSAAGNGEIETSG